MNDGDKLYRLCEICEYKLGEFTTDPFLEEIHDIVKYRWLCFDCYDERRMDI